MEHFSTAKRAPEMTNDCGLKQPETEKERGKKNVFIRNYSWMARSAALPFSTAECCDVNLCLVHKQRKCEGTYKEQNKHRHLFSYFFLSYTQTYTEMQVVCYLQQPSTSER